MERTQSAAQLVKELKSIMAENEDAKREKWGNVYRDEFDGRLEEGRRGGKRELALYRPGCGLFPKSPRGELEDNMSGSTSNLSMPSLGNGKKAPDVTLEGSQNGPQNGPNNGSYGHRGGGGGRKSHSSGRNRPSRRSDRSDRPDRSDGRGTRERKEPPMSKLSERLSQMQLKGEFSLQNNSEAHQSENPGPKLQNNHDGTNKKAKKPEQPLYIPKPVAQSMANKETANRQLNHVKEDLWTDDDSTSFCAEDVAGASQGSREGLRRKRPKAKKKKRGKCDASDSGRTDDSTAQDKPDASSHSCRSGQELKQDTSSRSNNLSAQDGRVESTRMGNLQSFGGRQEASRSRTVHEGKPDINSQLNSWAAQDPRSDLSKTNSRSTDNKPDSQSRLNSWASHDSKLDSVKSRPTPSPTPKSLGDSRRMEEDRRFIEDASLSQSWHADASHSSSRNVRLGSEPRSLPPDGPRSRDTRSVEPTSWNAEKIQAKPPSGRRGSGKDIGPVNNSRAPSKVFSNQELPPRFRKLKGENGTKESTVMSESYPREGPSTASTADKAPPKSYIGTTSEEVWDGTTVTFQGSHGSQNTSASNFVQFQSLPSMSLPPTPIYSQNPQSQMYQSYPNEQWSNTMPVTRPRGRGRLRPDEVEKEKERCAAAGARFSRSGTPDTMSVSSSIENLSQNFSHSSTRGILQQHGRSQDHMQKPCPLSSAPSLTSASPSGLTSGGRNQALPSPGPLRRKPSGSSLHDENRAPTSAVGSSGCRTPTGRRTPTTLTGPSSEHRQAISPVPRRIPESPDAPPQPYVPEITDWNEEVERTERQHNPTCSPSPVIRSDNVPISSQDWSEEVEETEKRQAMMCDSHAAHTDHFAVPCQDWSEEVERSERLETGGGSEVHTRSPSPVSRTDDSSMWKKPTTTSQWRRGRRSASGDRHANLNHVIRHGSKERGHDHSGRGPSRGGSREHSMERGNVWQGGPSIDQGSHERLVSWRGDEKGAGWRRDHSQERVPVDHSHGAPWRHAGRDHSGERMGRQRRHSPIVSKRGWREHSPHDQMGRRGNARDHSAEKVRHRRGSGRDHSPERNRNRRNSTRDHSAERGRNRRNSGRDHSGERDCDRGRNRRNSGRDHSRDRREHSREGNRRMGLEWRRHHSEGIDEDWRRPVPSGDNSKQSPPKTTAPGILVLPQDQSVQPVPSQTVATPGSTSQRQLYDPNNPNKPIIVVNPSVRASPSANSNGASEDGIWPGHQSNPVYQQRFEATSNFVPPQLQPTASLVANQFGSTRPVWYDPYNEGFRMSTQPHLIHDIEKADLELQWIISSGSLLNNWERVEYIRKFLQHGLLTLLLTDIKFLHKENADQHLWKILFYNPIEVLRKGVLEGGPNRDQHRLLLLHVIDQGTQYLESLLAKLQEHYKVRLDDFTSGTGSPGKVTAPIALALMVAQKLYLFLGDLARYREQANDTSNYGKARQWYIKAHQLNPKSGKPYNQLAILAVYARRKLDAVYYYMRGLMASNCVVHTARENLLSLFDENRKKYEQTEKKRREEREAKERSRMLEKESGSSTSLRREVWVHPSGGERVCRTTSNNLQPDHSDNEEELSKLTTVELNKRFVMSYLHIHGKLFTKVGMETFQEAAVQMLQEFHALLQHSPIPLNANRFLQLLALNMFAIDNTQLKEEEADYRSAAQEAALLVSLQMFSVLLERCVSLLRAQVARGGRPEQLVDLDVVALLPAIKVWCDWLTCHANVWNPPPCATDYHVGPPGDTWSRLATLVNLLDTLEYQRARLSEKPLEGFIQIRLPEDATLAGFTPLMTHIQEPAYAPRDGDMELTHVCLRVKRLLFFGHTILCGIDPPVLKLHKDENRSEYISVVARAQGRRQARRQHLPELSTPPDSLSEDDQELDLDMDLSPPKQDNAAIPEPAADATEVEIRALLQRKEQLERDRRRQERHRKKVQEILRQSMVEVEVEVRPHYIVPDTNCFVDYLAQIKTLSTGQAFQMMVPIAVMSELEGLQRGGCKPGDARGDAAHSDQVARAAKEALAFLRQRPANVRCVTTRGAQLPKSTNLTMEEDVQEMKNDDKILTTCLNLSRTSSKDEVKPGEPRRLVRDVVLLTEDRNLRVKALSRDVPVRELPDFMRWAFG